MNGPQPTVPSILLPEILGFSPQLLLDDIFNSANEAVRHTVDAVEQFFDKEADKHTSAAEDWDASQEVELGLVAFSTLLDSHVDIAFDFFEAWSLRNIFAIPADLPVVVPHQEGLDLDQPPEREAELLAEVEELRRKINNMRRLERLYTRAIRKSSVQMERSKRRLEHLSFLQSPTMETLAILPDQFFEMYNSVSTLPPVDHSSESAITLSQLRLSDPGKRQWETNRTGYFNWAVEQLLAKTRDKDRGAGTSAIDQAVEISSSVATASDVKALLKELGQESVVVEHSEEQDMQVD